MWLGKQVYGPFRGGAGRMAVLALFGLLFWAAGNRIGGLEARVHDLMQRVSAGPAPANVVIVGTDEVAGDPWFYRGFAELIGAVAQADPRAVAIANPAPPAIRREDVDRLNTLIELETRAGAAADDRRLEGLRRQLGEARAQVEEAAMVAAAMADAGNVVLGLAPLTRQPVAADPGSPCESRLAAVGRAFGSPPPEGRTAAYAPVAAELCLAAAAIGHLDWLADDDGTVRRSPTLEAGPAGLVPPVSLATLLHAGIGNGERVPPGSHARGYSGPGGSSGFVVVGAAEVLAGRGLDRLANNFVVIGSMNGPGLPTSVSGAAGPAILLATDLANRLEARYLQRPRWVRGTEVVLVLLLAAGLAYLLYPRPWLHGVAGALIAAGGLLLVQLVLLAAFGVRTQLATLALYAPLAAAALPLFRLLPGPGGTAQAEGVRTAPGAAPREREELDLAFSVLRQQPTNEQTKLKLYELAMEHGRRRDYARAERVFRHLSARDPDYKDVAAKLEKLSGARVASQGRPIQRPVTSDASQGINRALGRYELERVIGRGAMATVYLGRDPTINRRVAIKTVPLAEEFADNDLASARANFIREAQSSGRLNHPNIIAIHDAGEENHVAYLAMEYFDGKPLSYYTQVGRLLPPRKVCELMARAADTLHYAHTQNVVHRDVKPANLLYDEVSDTLKLTDFGIARLTDTNRTRTGIILGTPSYMSPEQLQASKVSGQSDLYSLGVTMYHLLTGSPPFQADSISRLMDRIVHEPHRPVRDVRDDIPACADEILERALSKRPQDRFPDGQAMAAALRSCCARFPSELL